MGIHLGLIIIDPSRESKDKSKYNLPIALVREALEWPANVEVRPDDDPVHGWRVLAFGITADGHEVFAALLPVPAWEYENADTWCVRHARFL